MDKVANGSKWDAIQFAIKAMKMKPFRTKLPVAQRDAILEEEIAFFQAKGKRAWVDQRDLASAVRGLKTVIEAADPANKALLEKALAFSENLAATNDMRQSMAAYISILHQGQTNACWDDHSKGVAKAVIARLLS